VRKPLVVLGAGALGLVALLAVGDRVAAAAAERAITNEVAGALGEASSVTTTVHGVPLLTQVAGGSLDHVTVALDEVSVPDSVAIDSLVVDVYDVRTTAPRVAGRVEAVATVSLAAIQQQAGPDWVVEVEDEGLLVSSTGALPVQVRLVPSLADGTLGFDLDRVRLFGISVDGDAIPDQLVDAVADLDADLGDLPLGLEPTAVEVTPEGVVVAAAGTDVDLEAAR
jgi:hypothetical protein